MDKKRLVRAIRIVADAEPYFLEYTAEAKRLADDVATEYARLAPPADLDALAASGNRSLKEEADRKADSDRLDALAAQREQRRQTRTPK